MFGCRLHVIHGLALCRKEVVAAVQPACVFQVPPAQLFSVSRVAPGHHQLARGTQHRVQDHLPSAVALLRSMHVCIKQCSLQQCCFGVQVQLFLTSMVMHLHWNNLKSLPSYKAAVSCAMPACT
jgi:hypothetical protein